MNDLLTTAYIETAGIVFLGFVGIGAMGLIYGQLWHGVQAFLGTGGAYRPNDE